MTVAEHDSDETLRLLGEVADGEWDAFVLLFERYRPLVQGVVRKRLDSRLVARVDSSDLLQETQIAALRRMEDYLQRRPMPFRLWILKTAYEQIRRVERRHLEAAKRAVDRQLPLPDQSSLRLAAGQYDSPSGPVRRRELATRVRTALACLSESDREIVMLRNFDNLTNAEAASILEITPDTARKRYRRALLRLQKHLRSEQEGLP